MNDLLTEPPEDSERRIEVAREAFKQATIARLKAEHEWHLAETALYDAWFRIFGSLRHKGQKFNEDRDRILKEAGARW